MKFTLPSVALLLAISSAVVGGRAVAALPSVALLLAISSAAFAQMPPSTGASTTPAVPPAGMQGSSPQTATSARTQIEASGYTRIKDLKRNEDGSWHAIATKNDTEVAVMVDTAGNVTQTSR